jgi:hypothetical protein
MDYFEQEAQATPGELTELASACNDLKRAAARVAELEERLKAAQDEHDRLSSNVIPEMLARMGLREVALLDGTKVSVKMDIRASIPKGVRGTQDRREEAFEWLRQNGFGSLIKVTVSTRFGMGHEQDARVLADTLAQQYDEVTLDENVHSATLASFVRERLAAGQTLPDAISVTQLPTTILTGEK